MPVKSRICLSRIATRFWRAWFSRRRW